MSLARALFGQMARLPFAMVAATLGMLETAARRLEDVAGMGFEESHEGPSEVESDSPFESTPARPRSQAGWIREEKTKMADTNLNDNMVKLVEYSILTIQREHEEILQAAQQTIVTDDLTGDAFSNARIADWVKQGLPGLDPKQRDALDLDSLRVYYNVLQRWPKEELKYQERTLKQEARKIELLEKIANK